MELFPSNSNYNFMRVGRASLIIAFLIMVVAFGAMATKGFNYALDFTGGTVVELRFEKPVDGDTVRRVLTQRGFESPLVQSFGTTNDIVVRLKPRAGDGDATRSG
jgi:preprotein translocase subunit SecF